MRLNNFAFTVMVICLLGSTLLIGATSSSSTCASEGSLSEYEVRDVGDYDPWCDLNDDGSIDIFDVVKLVDLYGTVGAPINKTALLLDLQERILTLEERTDSIRIITFFTSNETAVEAGEPLNMRVASFQWIPNNATHNAILSCNVYFQFRLDTTPGDSIPLYGLVMINNGEVGITESIDFITLNHSEYVWLRVQNIPLTRDFNTFHPNRGNNPNQASYTIELMIRVPAGSGTVYIKDVSMILRVVDGS